MVLHSQQPERYRSRDAVHSGLQVHDICRRNCPDYRNAALARVCSAFQSLPPVQDEKILPPGTHIEAAKGTTEQNIEYCSKEGWPVEYGTRPKTRAQIGEDNAARYADAIQAAKEGRMDDIPPDLRTKHYNTYKNIAKDYMPKPDSSPRRVDYGSMARLEPERPMPW